MNKVIEEFYIVPRWTNHLKVFIKGKAPQPLTLLQKNLIGYINGFNGQNKSCWASNPEIAESLGASARTIENNLSFLYKHGFADKDLRYKKTRKGNPTVEARYIYLNYPRIDVILSVSGVARKKGLSIPQYSIVDGQMQLLH